MELFLTILPILFTHLFGFFDACQTARKDYGFADYNRIWQYYRNKGEDYQQWYRGGNDKYPPGNPLQCDFWHFCKHMWTFCLSAIALSVILVSITYPSYWLLVYGFLYGIEGLSFTFYYSYVLRSDRNFRWYLHHLLFENWKRHE